MFSSTAHAWPRLPDLARLKVLDNGKPLPKAKGDLGDAEGRTVVPKPSENSALTTISQVLINVVRGSPRSSVRQGYFAVATTLDTERRYSSISPDG